jgi:PAS domain S-box-containing protein
MQPNLNFFSYLVSHAREMLAYHDHEGIFLYLNEASGAILGYPPQHFIGRSPVVFAHALHREKLEEHFTAIRTEKEKRSLEFQCLCSDAGYVWLQIITTPILDHYGEVTHMASSFRDVSSLYQVRDRLEKSETILQQASEIAQVGYWEVRLHDLQPIWSDITKKIHEVPTHFIADIETAKAFYPEEARKILEQKMEEALHQGTGFDLTLPFITYLKNERWVRVIGKVIFQDGQPYRFYGIFQDVTSQMEEQDKLRQLVQKLSNHQIRLEEFNQVVSHNLRGPVANVTTLVQLLEEEKEAEKKDTIFKFLKNSALQLEQTLNELVEVVRIQNEELPFREKVILREVWEEVLSLYRGKLSEINAIECLYDEDISTIYFPRHYVKAALMNLVDNAIKYRSDQRVLHLQLHTQLSTTDRPQLVFKDNGVGLDLEKHGHKLFQLYKTLHTQPTGKGLGLYLTKTQMEKAGGTIEAQAPPEGGLQFTLSF